MADKQSDIKYLTEYIDEVLMHYWDVTPEAANRLQIYRALSTAVRQILEERRRRFKRETESENKKQVYYMCMEFLVGRSLRNNLFNLKLEETAASAIKKYNVTLEELYAIEKDPGLGNGGLGRLAACFMDSLATMDYPAVGFSIKYEYGLFKQKIIDGWQTELPDDWLATSDVWLVPRVEERVIVRFDGEIKEEWTEHGLRINHYNATEVEAVPYDMMISGYGSRGVSLLRLWEAKSAKSLDMNLFSQGEYIKALADNSMAETISKVLYPADNHYEGRLLRIRQQYFLVSASAQTIVNNHYKKYKTLNNFCDKVAIHINDTHPALIVPELMRIFMDGYGLSWDEAWHQTESTVSYTNHTVLQEALETWEDEIIKTKLPRIYSIIKEINQRFCTDVWNRYEGGWDMAERMSILSHGRVRMANLSIVGSHSVNGVARLHTEILKNTIFKDFYRFSPQKFVNITNGITHRRWLSQANPELARLIDELIGPDYLLNPEDLSKLKKYSGDALVLQKLADIKHGNKLRLAKFIKNKTGIEVNIDSVFDIQVKRLHEYKRQLLNVLRIINIINDIRDGNTGNIVPETFIFAAKAAPSYFRAKEIIHLICSLSSYVNQDPKLKEYISVVFIENYDVSSAEIIIPAGEISEQISLAGKEASGTGNMKFMLNGALTVGTLDGANIEIYDAVGDDNFFLFGLKDYEAEKLWKSGYNSVTYYQQNPAIRRIIDFLNGEIYDSTFESISKYLLGGDSVGDPYMCLADFADYVRVHDRASHLYYEDKKKWNSMSLVNISSAGIFSSDRTVREYAEKIWKITRV